MLSFNILIVVSLTYVVFLFGIAFWAERRSRQGQGGWLRSSMVYTLSLSIYCTAWTFYGAVGYASRSGLEYLTIYLGPTIVMIGWWWILRKLVRIGRSQKITSIADLVSSRFGKSTALGVLVTLIMVTTATPYLALQLQSVTLSLAVFSELDNRVWGSEDLARAAFWVAVGLASFTVIFGTRNLDANERHHGIVIAVAVEAVVKLIALVAVGIFVVWGIAGGLKNTIALIDASPISTWEQPGGRWFGLIFLSGAAFLCLPRMFQVLVVENSDEEHLLTASWAFPLYLLAMSLFVVPIAVVGLQLMPAGSNPDLFVLTIPLAEGRNGLAVLSFLGGFSSATSMVIVATIALATMVSNHIVTPIWLSSRGPGAVVSGDIRRVVVTARRLSIAGVLFLGYMYYRLSGGGTALAAIGLVSFTGTVQVLPAMLGGIFWRGATRWGAAAGLVVGALIWTWTLFLPSFGSGLISEQVFQNGPLGIGILRPEALFGITGIDPLLHGVLWSLLLNATTFFIVSVMTFPQPLERLQGAQFVKIFELSGGAKTWTASNAEAEDLLVMAQRILGPSEAQELFQREAAHQGKDSYLPEVTPEFVQLLERRLAGSVGAATAHAMVGQFIVGATVSVEDLIAVADEAAQIMEYSSKLEAKSAEQERTARQLRQANEKLTALSVQKDAFLSQISHELRTPMTSIRSFSEILREGMTDSDSQKRYLSIIHDEAIRLTRLLDDLLDLSVLENGQVALERRKGVLKDVLDQAIAASQADTGDLTIVRRRFDESIQLHTDLDRLAQVFINLISNTQKYCDADRPRLAISCHNRGGNWVVDFVDNGTGIPKENQDLIFEKFARLVDHRMAGGTGLGLAICREIMLRLGGTISYLPGQGGCAFRVTLPQSAVIASG